MKNNLLILSRLLILASVLYSCHSGTANKKTGKLSNKDELAFEGFIVKPSQLDNIIMVSGTIMPFEETVLMPEITGRVVIINLQEGKFVKKGTLLIKIFDGDLQANLKKSETQLKIAEETQKRQDKLLEINGISQLDYDLTVLQVTSIQDDIEVLKVQIGKTEILAPFDGVIGLRNVSLGAEVSPSTPLATIRMTDKLKLDFSVPEKYSRQTKPGTKVDFTVQGDDKKHSATVMATEQGIEANTRNLKVRAIIDDASSSLVPGAFANVELLLNHTENAMMIPSQAIIPQELKKKIIVSKSGVAKFIDINTGIRQASMVEVLSGLNAGDTVVVTGILFLKPGSHLKFLKVKSN